MDAADDEILRQLQEEELAREEAERERRRTARGRIAAVAITVGVLGMAGLFLWAYLADAERSQSIVLIGREDATVRVEVEGRSPVEVQPRGGTVLTLSRPGPRRFRFTSLDTEESFEQVLDVPPKQRGLDDTRLAVPTEEGTCFALLDIDAWYGEAQGLLELATQRAEGAADPRPSDAAPLPRPRVVARLRPLDPLPTRGYTRNLRFHDTIGADRRATSLVDVACEDLSLTDEALVDQALERYLPR